MNRAGFIALALLSTLVFSCAPTSPKQVQGKLILDLDEWFEAERGFGVPDKFRITHQGRNYLVFINCPFSGRAATFSYILEQREGGHVLLQKLHHPEGSIAVSVELEHGALVFKDYNGYPVLEYTLDD